MYPLTGSELERARFDVISNHYTGSVPAGKSYYFRYQGVIVVWSIPANKNIARFLLGGPGVVWELSRLWAADGHKENILTQAISRGVKDLRSLEYVDAVVSYADPNVGHRGGVYLAASWLFHGQSEEGRCYISKLGVVKSRRAFHSGGKAMTKEEILSIGYTEHKRAGKLRFVRGITRKSRKHLALAALSNCQGKEKIAKIRRGLYLYKGLYLTQDKRGDWVATEDKADAYHTYHGADCVNPLFIHNTRKDLTCYIDREGWQQ